MLTITLDSIRKDGKAKGTYRMIPRASCNGQTVSGDHRIIENLSAVLIDTGCSPDDEVVVMRGSTICFHPHPLGMWAQPYYDRQKSFKMLSEQQNKP